MKILWTLLKWKIIFLPLTIGAVSSCEVCGDKAGDTEKSAHCAGSIIEEEDNDNGSDSSVTITQPETAEVSVSGVRFNIHKTEVTNTHYASFLANRGAIQGTEGDQQNNDCNESEGVAANCYDYLGSSAQVQARITGETNEIKDNLGDHPVSFVTWYGAKAYCEAIGMELPSEEKWKLAANEGNERTYPWGDDDPTCDFVNASVDPDNTFCVEGTTAVNSDTASNGDTSLGIRHMSGNVAEWVEDAIENNRGIKGGSYLTDNSVSELTIDITLNAPADKSFADVGFRCIENL